MSETRTVWRIKRKGTHALLGGQYAIRTREGLMPFYWLADEPALVPVNLSNDQLEPASPHVAAAVLYAAGLARGEMYLAAKWALKAEGLGRAFWDGFRSLQNLARQQGRPELVLTDLLAPSDEEMLAAIAGEKELSQPAKRRRLRHYLIMEKAAQDLADWLDEHLA